VFLQIEKDEPGRSSMSAPGSPDGSEAASRLLGLFDLKQPHISARHSDPQLEDSVSTQVLEKTESDGSLPSENQEEKFASFSFFFLTEKVL